jgi:hypothetical protein
MTVPEPVTETNPGRERLRVLTQAVAGAALSGKTEEDAEKRIGTTAPENAALGKRLANWRSVVENLLESNNKLATANANRNGCLNEEQWHANRETVTQAVPAPLRDGSMPQVFTLSEAAAYLRLPEAEVLP